MIAVVLAFLVSNHVFGQGVLEIGEAFDVDIKVTQTYQNFKSNSLSKIKTQLVYEQEFYSQNAGYVKLYFKNFDQE